MDVSHLRVSQGVWCDDCVTPVDVDFLAVFFISHDFRCHPAVRASVACHVIRLTLEAAQPEIPDLECPSRVYQQVVRLQIPAGRETCSEHI